MPESNETPEEVIRLDRVAIRCGTPTAERLAPSYVLVISATSRIPPWLNAWQTAAADEYLSANAKRGRVIAANVDLVKSRLDELRTRIEEEEVR